jgi:hypothetical protein
LQATKRERKEEEAEMGESEAAEVDTAELGSMAALASDRGTISVSNCPYGGARVLVEMPVRGEPS